MAIQQDAILGQDCTIALQTASFIGAIINWDETRFGLEYVRREFTPASASVTGFITPHKRVPPITIRLRRGLAQTFKDLKAAFDDQNISLLTITDFIANQSEFNAYEAEFGPCQVMSVQAVQGEEGIADITVEFGGKTHGYSPVV